MEGMSMPKLSSDHVLAQPSLFEAAPQHPRWEDLPTEVRRQAAHLLSELLLDRAARSLVDSKAEGGNDE
jgi:hypothetical protein